MSSQRRPRIPRFDLYEIYDAQQLQDVVQIARERVLHTFDHATEDRSGVPRGTNHYIAGAGTRQCELAAFVLQRRMKPFISLTTLPALPPQLIGLPGRHAYRELVRQLQELTVRLAIESLVREQVIWHDDCVWNVLPVTLQAYRDERHAITKVTKAARTPRRTVLQKG